mgnify:FL=1
MTSSTTLRTGELFPYGAPTSPFIASISQTPLTCVYTTQNIKNVDIELFEHGKASFAFVQPFSGIISFMMEIQGFCQWSDCHYAPCTDFFSVNQQAIETKINTHTPVVLVLVDSDTGIIKALRMFTVSHPFIFRLNQALKNVYRVNLSQQAYRKVANLTIEKYSTRQLVKMAKHIERGGQTVN